MEHVRDLSGKHRVRFLKAKVVSSSCSAFQGVREAAQ